MTEKTPYVASMNFLPSLLEMAYTNQLGVLMKSCMHVAKIMCIEPLPFMSATYQGQANEQFNYC
jgi:hypothetical protein